MPLTVLLVPLGVRGLVGDLIGALLLVPVRVSVGLIVVDSGSGEKGGYCAERSEFTRKLGLDRS